MRTLLALAVLAAVAGGAAAVGHDPTPCGPGVTNRPGSENCPVDPTETITVNDPAQPEEATGPTDVPGEGSPAASAGAAVLAFLVVALLGVAVVWAVRTRT